MPQLIDERVIRLALDINVLFADILSRQQRRRGTASSMLVEAIRDGTCPAGPVQLVTSVPIIENYANLLQRKLGYSRAEADEKAWLLQQYAIAGPVSYPAQIPVGAGYIPFETEAQMRQSIESFSAPHNAEKLFHEIQDDRYVLETALAGRADVLATADIDDFLKGPVVLFERDDMALSPFGGHRLIIAKPSFVAYWLRQGEIPDASLITSRPDEFRLR
jgi:PIN domain